MKKLPATLKYTYIKFQKELIVKLKILYISTAILIKSQYFKIQYYLTNSNDKYIFILKININF